MTPGEVVAELSTALRPTARPGSIDAEAFEREPEGAAVTALTAGSAVEPIRPVRYARLLTLPA